MAEKFGPLHMYPRIRKLPLDVSVDAESLCNKDTLLGDATKGTMHVQSEKVGHCLSEQTLLRQQTETHTQHDVSRVSKSVCTLLNREQCVKWPFGSLCSKRVILPCADNEETIQSTREESQSPAYQGSTLLFAQIFDNTRQVIIQYVECLCAVC